VLTTATRGEATNSGQEGIDLCRTFGWVKPVLGWLTTRTPPATGVPGRIWGQVPKSHQVLVNARMCGIAGYEGPLTCGNVSALGS